MNKQSNSKKSVQPHFVTIILLVVIELISIHTSAQNKPSVPYPNNSIIPAPVSYQLHSGYVRANDVSIVVKDSSLVPASKYLFEYLNKYTTIKANLTDKRKRNSGLPILLLENPRILNPSEYQLQVKPEQIEIKGNASSVFYGVQTLIQMLSHGNPDSIQTCTINDSARFSWRGMHLDVARHFQPIGFIKRYLDYLALHKLNTFHWHLTDDQGWRIEIKKYPNLTSIGSKRAQTLIGPYGTNRYDSTPHFGFYTQSEIREIVKYAAQRNITIVPEIEMPGHSLAALSAYPWLGCNKGPFKVMETWGVSEDVMCAGNDSTFNFLNGVLEEVMDLFPGNVIHVGGDECPKVRWKQCIKCQNRIKKEGLKDEAELQSFFMRKIERTLSLRGKRMIGWDEILEGGLPPKAMVMSWRGEDGGIAAAKEKHEVIMTPGKPLYFDHTQRLQEDSITQGGYNSLEAVYNYNPIPNQLDSAFHGFILGAQANVWTEYMPSSAKIEYMIFPRIAALSEMLWTPLSKKSWTQFENKFPILLNWYKKMGINYSDAYYDLLPKWETDGKGKLIWKLTTKQKGGSIWIAEPNKNFQKYKQPFLVKETGIYHAFWQSENGIQSSDTIKQNIYINKATGKLVKLSKEPSSSYAHGGVLTLTDGIQNMVGMSKSAQFLGFWGDDLTIDLDLGKKTSFQKVALRTFSQAASWIYAPKAVHLEGSIDGNTFFPIDTMKSNKYDNHVIFSSDSNRKIRFIRFKVLNHGVIENDMPGAGNPAWLFIDEIEVY